MVTEYRRGPKITITISATCSGCAYHCTEHYAVQGDSGIDHSCVHPGVGTRDIDSGWVTPKWCPELERALSEARS